jgi:AcrR family transcriptional regulator
VDLKPDSTRRRGAELEGAILDAAWTQLTENGYGAFTFEAVAARAGTSRPVLYRRWKDREQLMIATIVHERAKNPVEIPDTGNLRDDVVLVLRRVSHARTGFTALLSVQLAEYFRETGSTFNDLKRVLTSGPRSGMDIILDHAEARGDIDRSKIDARTIELPSVLMRYEIIVTLDRMRDETIDEIVDDIWMPLLRAKGALLKKA